MSERQSNDPLHGITLAQWAFGLANFHIGFHIDHMREILQALGLQGKKPASRTTGNFAEDVSKSAG